MDIWSHLRLSNSQPSGINLDGRLSGMACLSYAHASLGSSALTGRKTSESRMHCGQFYKVANGSFLTVWFPSGWKSWLGERMVFISLRILTLVLTNALRVGFYVKK